MYCFISNSLLLCLLLICWWRLVAYLWRLFLVVTLSGDLFVTFICKSVCDFFLLFVTSCFWSVLLTFIGDLFVTFTYVYCFFSDCYWWSVCLFGLFVFVFVLWVFAEVICGWAFGIYLFVSLLPVLAQTTSVFTIGMFLHLVVVRTNQVSEIHGRSAYITCWGKL